jgi:hypothetical protein
MTNKKREIDANTISQVNTNTSETKDSLSFGQVRLFFLMGRQAPYDFPMALVGDSLVIFAASP